MIQALPATSRDTTITLDISGSDDTNGSGIAHYEIFVSDNDGEFVALDDFAFTSVFDFVGDLAHEYKFYSIAWDNVGHSETAPVDFDAETLALSVQQFGQFLIGKIDVAVELRTNLDRNSDGKIDAADIVTILGE